MRKGWGWKGVKGRKDEGRWGGEGDEEEVEESDDVLRGEGDLELEMGERGVCMRDVGFIMVGEVKRDEYVRPEDCREGGLRIEGWLEAADCTVGSCFTDFAAFFCMRQWILNQFDRRPYRHPDLDIPTVRHFRSLQALQEVLFLLSITHLKLFLQSGMLV